MRLFLQVCFWSGVGGAAIRLLEMAVREWPKTQEVSLGFHTALTIIGIGFTVWAGFLLFG